MASREKLSVWQTNHRLDASTVIVCFMQEEKFTSRSLRNAILHKLEWRKVWVVRFCIWICMPIAHAQNERKEKTIQFAIKKNFNEKFHLLTLKKIYKHIFRIKMTKCCTKVVDLPVACVQLFFSFFGSFSVSPSRAFELRAFIYILNFVILYQCQHQV